MKGVRIGHYAIGEPLGSGAMGEVRGAFDVTDGQAVAIKLLTAKAARRRDAVQIFAREVRAVARLNHPHVVRILDQGTLEDDTAERLSLPANSPWFTMERAAGSAQRPIRNWPELQRLLLAVLEGLAHCHARGMVHRDLKPQNILRIGSTWKLADFGLALPLDELDQRVAGTPLYMAPEQFSTPDQVGPWSDLYAVGCLLWTRATGYPPFLGDIKALRAAHLAGVFPDFTPQFVVAPPVVEWMRRLLHREPEQRFDHAWEARTALLAMDAHSASPLPSSPHPRGGQGLIGLRELPLVGRVEEAAMLERQLEQALAGSPQIVSIEGVAGCGKTHLARQVLRKAAERGRVDWFEIRNLKDTSGLVDLAARWLRRPRSPVRGPDRNVLEAWVDFHSPTPPLDDRIDAILNALEVMQADRPVALLIDDVQWDVESQILVRCLAKAQLPSFVLVTERLEPGESTVLASGTPTLRLGALTHEEAESLAAAVLGRQGTRAIQLAEISRGSPLLAVQLAVHFARTGRFAVQSNPLRAWAARLDAVVSENPTLWSPLRRIAVVGGRASWAEWEWLGGTSISALIRAVLAEETATGWQLVHPLLVDAIRARTDQADWTARCLHAAHALVDADPLRRARLFEEGGAPETACEIALGVHGEAFERGDAVRAQASYVLALASGAMAEQVAVAGFLQRCLEGRIDSSEIAEMYERHPSPRLGFTLARTLAFSATPEAALSVLTTLEPGVEVQLLQAAVHERMGRLDDADAQLAGLPTPTHPWLRIDWMRKRGRVAHKRGDYAEATRWFGDAMGVAEAHGIPHKANATRVDLAATLRSQGHFEHAEALLREVLHHARGFTRVDAEARVMLGLVLLDADHPVRAALILEPFTADPNPILRTVAHAALARIRASLGELEHVSKHVEQLVAIPDPECHRQLEALRELVAYEPELEAQVVAALTA